MKMFPKCYLKKKNIHIFFLTYFLLFSFCIVSISDYLLEAYEVSTEYEHEIKSKGKKTYHCNCSRVFVSAENLLFHQQNECGRKRLFKCNECRYASNRRTNFKRHLESSHHKRNMQRWFWN